VKRQKSATSSRSAPKQHSSISIHSNKTKNSAEESEEDEDEDDMADLEDAYFARQKAKEASKHTKIDKVKAVSNPVKASSQSKSTPAGTRSGDESNDDAPPVHESLSSSKVDSSRDGIPKKHYAPPDETAQKRDERTIFIGNAPPEVAKNKASFSIQDFPASPTKSLDTVIHEGSYSTHLVLRAHRKG
jgi:nucleolar protein 12